MSAASRFHKMRCFQAPRCVHSFDILKFRPALLEGKDGMFTSQEVSFLEVQVHRIDGLLVNLATRFSFYYQVDRLSAAKRFAISLIVLQSVPRTGGL